MLPTSNWIKLSNKLNENLIESKKVLSQKKKRKRTEINDALRKNNEDKLDQNNNPVTLNDNLPEAERLKYVGLDCEMVGLGPDGKMSALARCSLVDYDGNAIYDEFVRPKGFVTDFRTKYSGVRRCDLREAIDLLECQKDVAKLLQGKILVGHALKNDLDVLMLSHHASMIRDTATHQFYMKSHGRDGGKWRPRALRDLSKEYLNMIIQTGEHNPTEDAKAAMLLYRYRRIEWEKELITKKKERKAQAIKLSNSNNSNNKSESNTSNQPKKKAKKNHSVRKSIFDIS